MISVLIASYNRNVVNLVNELHSQLIKTKVSFEIICFDDASRSASNINNIEINQLSNCSFKTLEKNIGRSAIRNLLATKASFNWLLFLDADVLPTSSKFIEKYLENIKTEENDVFLGGIKYRECDDKRKLRWKFGKKNEEVTSTIRNKNPEKYFFTANFLIQKSTFNSIKFNEELTEYGYEDLLFAKELNQSKIAIKHTENEVFHLGIDTNLEFVLKTKKAINNLCYLIKNKRINIEDTNLSKQYFKIKPFGIFNVLNLFSKYFEKQTIQRSSIFYYNLFRVTYLDSVFKNRN